MKLINIVRKEVENTLDVEIRNSLQYSSSISEADDIHNILDYLENNFGIPKAIIDQLESSKTYHKFLEDHIERLDHITNNIKEKK